MRNAEFLTGELECGFTPSTTVGLEMRGVVVYEILAGSAADACSQIEVGDALLYVDDCAADEANARALLIGCDVEGSVVDLTLVKKRTGVVVHVPLVRERHTILFSQRERGFVNQADVRDVSLQPHEPELNGDWRVRKELQELSDYDVLGDRANTYVEAEW
jgi:hypothetical protein